MNDEEKSKLNISEINGRTQIVNKRIVLKGKVSNTHLMESIKIAAMNQVEYLINKLSRGSPLDASEVKQLKELAEIAKIDVPVTIERQVTLGSVSLKEISSQLYDNLITKD